MSNSYPPVPPVEPAGTTTGSISASGTSGIGTSGIGTPGAGSSGIGSSGVGSSGVGSSGSGTSDVAKDQASQLGNKAAAAGQDVKETAKDEASKVASEAKTQAKDLYRNTKGELKDQAASQQQRVATGLHSISDELGSMASNSENDGVATDLVRQAASRAGSVASWLEDRDPGSLLDEVRSFARQRPGTFIAAAAVAGILAGRLTRSIASEAHDEKTSSTPSTGVRTGQPVVVPVSYADPTYSDPAYSDPTLTGQSPAYGATGDLASEPSTTQGGDPYLGGSRR